MEVTFLNLYSGQQPVDVDLVLEYLLNEQGVREELDEKEFVKMMARGRKIAELQKKISRQPNPK